MRPSIKLVVIYLLFASLWIAFSDYGLEILSSDSHSIPTLQTVKGMFFVFITAGLLYGLVQNELTARDKIEQELRTLNETLEDRVKRRTDELQTANNRLSELDQLKTRFIEQISHDLRTPITNITMRLDLLERTCTPDQTRHINKLKTYVEHLGALVADILDLAYLEEIPEADSEKSIDLNDLIRKNLVVYTSLAEHKGLQINHELAENLPPAVGDEGLIDRVVSNLLSNAVKYTLHGSITIKTWANELNEVYMLVQDSGMGIAPEDISQLFSRFFRGREARRSGIVGTGLGLGIVKEIVDLYGGKIEVESTLNQGSTFTLSLPVGK